MDMGLNATSLPIHQIAWQADGDTPVSDQVRKALEGLSGSVFGCDLPKWYLETR